MEGEPLPPHRHEEEVGARDTQQGTRRQWRGARRSCTAPHRHSVEQVVGVGVDMVDRRFGPATGRFGSWAQNEVWSTPDALQLSLRVQGH